MNKSKLVVLIALPAIFIVLMMGLFTENVSPYVSVSELMTEDVTNRNVQVFGQVIIESIYFNQDSGIITFELTDGNQSVQVNHKGMINNLQNSTEVVAIGKYNNIIFNADKVLVKCPSKYEGLASEEG
ncbi:cytochrome c maturation protein CcmE [Thermoproteota archaeon]